MGETPLRPNENETPLAAAPSANPHVGTLDVRRCDRFVDLYQQLFEKSTKENSQGTPVSYDALRVPEDESARRELVDDLVVIFRKELKGRTSKITGQSTYVGEAGRLIDSRPFIDAITDEDIRAIIAATRAIMPDTAILRGDEWKDALLSGRHGVIEALRQLVRVYAKTGNTGTLVTHSAILASDLVGDEEGALRELSSKNRNGVMASRIQFAKQTADRAGTAKKLSQENSNLHRALVELMASADLAELLSTVLAAFRQNKSRFATGMDAAYFANQWLNVLMKKLTVFIEPRLQTIMQTHNSYTYGILTNFLHRLAQKLAAAKTQVEFTGVIDGIGGE